jgi:PAS domain S-box-containing protein
MVTGRTANDENAIPSFAHTGYKKASFAMETSTIDIAHPTLLIAHPDPALVSELSGKTADWGYAPVGVATAEAVLAQVALETPDLLLLGLCLGDDRDGAALAEAVRNRCGEIPILYLAPSEAAAEARLSPLEPFGHVIVPPPDLLLRGMMEMAIYRFRMEKRLAEKERQIVDLQRRIGRPSAPLKTGPGGTPNDKAVAAEKFGLIANSSSDFMTLINRDYVYEAANSAYCKAHGKPPERIVGGSVEALWGGETFDVVIRDCLNRCLDGEEVHYEAWFRFDGRPRGYYSVNYYPFRDADGVVTHAAVVSRDITSRKRMEEGIRTSLEEKEVLLREIHHRVKNNLNVIISLIDMQERQSADEEVSTALTELQERIRAIAMVHEDLYQSENLARIAFRKYLENLVTDLFTVFDSEGISLDLAVADAALAADTAIPAGLIVNELITNALKHAFPKESRKRRENRGQIRIVFRRENGMCLLTVQDNGMGLPPDLDWRTADSLGLRMIRILAKQLMGTLQVDDGEGTTISVAFPAVSNRPVFSRKPSDAEKDPPKKDPHR